jgi:ankyrin repeat protein
MAETPDLQKAFADAIYSEDIQTAKELLKQGLNISNDSDVLLLKSVMRNKFASVELLLENGANVNVVDRTYGSPIHIAINSQT